MTTLYRALFVVVAIQGWSAAAHARPLVAVLDFTEARTGMHIEELAVLGDISRGEALEILGHDYDIITRENLVDLLKSHGKNLEQCSGECETETGRLLGAELVVSGRIVKAFGKYKVNLKVHRTNPPALLGAKMITADALGELEAAVRDGTRKVLASVPGARTAGEPSPPRDVARSGSSRPLSKRSVAKKLLKGVLGSAGKSARSTLESTARSAQAVSDLAEQARALREGAESLVKAWAELEALATNEDLPKDQRIAAVKLFLEQAPEGSGYADKATDLLASLELSRRYWRTKTEWASLAFGVSSDEYFGSGVLIVGFPLLKGDNLYWQTVELEIASGRSDTGSWSSTVGYHHALDDAGRTEVRVGLGLRYADFRGPEDPDTGYCCDAYSGLALVPECAGVFHVTPYLSAQLKLRYLILSPGDEEQGWVPFGIFLGSAGVGF
jgi:hypothetical protein